MNKKRALTNIIVGIIFKLIILLLAMLTRVYVVKYLGNEANGLFSLYTSILGFITLANLGVGVAITFSMYKPIVENDTDAISALYYLYRKFYIIVMFIILALGLALTPFVPRLAKGSSENILIYQTYITFLVSVAITYLFGHKITLINAYKDNYITTTITSLALIFEGILQIFVLLITKNFLYFLLVRVLAYMIEGLMVEIVFRRKYKKRLNNNKVLNEDLKSEVIRNSGAKMYSEVGTKLISSFDGMIISFFVGVIALGKYSNYVIIIAGMFSLLNLLFTEITSILGHLRVKQSKETYYSYFKKTYAINFVVGIIFFLGYISISHNIIEIMFSKDHITTNFIMIVIAFDYYLNFMRRTPALFKRASGIIYEDRHRPLIEGIVNIILSIILVQFLGVGGVLVGTIITRLLISYTYEPHILFVAGFEKPNAKEFYKVHYGSFIVFVLATIVYMIIPKIELNNVYINLLFNGTLSVLVSLVFISILYIVYKPFRIEIKGLFNNGMSLLKSIVKKRDKDESN